MLRNCNLLLSRHYTVVNIFIANEIFKNVMAYLNINNFIFFRHVMHYKHSTSYNCFVVCNKPYKLRELKKK